MKRETFLTIAVAVLFFMNVGTMAFLFLHRPPHPGGLRGGLRPDKLIIESLSLNETQQKEFMQLKQAHYEAMVVLDQKKKDADRNYLEGIVNQADSLAIDSLNKVIGLVERQRATVTCNHFKDVRNICNDEQKQEFDQLLPELFRFLQGPKPPDRH